MGWLIVTLKLLLNSVLPEWFVLGIKHSAASMLEAALALRTCRARLVYPLWDVLNAESTVGAACLR